MMRVVSQNKDFSFDFEGAVFWTQDGYIYARVGVNNQVIGKYESDQRARKVFIDMHNAYSPVSLISTNLNEEQIEKFVGSVNVPTKCVEMNNLDTGITIFNNIVYYMPEE